MSFINEEEMSQYFSKFYSKILSTPDVEVLKECKGLYGIPDYLFIEKKHNDLTHIIAFELKLRNWKRGLTQAFKYRCYANQSYVVVDETHISSAIKNMNFFSQFNIGLASFNINNEFRIFCYPKYSVPFSNHLTKRVITKLSSSNDIENNGHAFNFNHKIKSRLSKKLMDFVCT